MAELLRCKSCGYVVEAGRVGEVCPACGVPRKMMEEWKDPVSASRRRVLRLDLHPIIDHFTVAFLATGFVLSVVMIAAPDLFPRVTTDLLLVLLGALPLAVIASFLSGLLDARVRFRRTGTPALTNKKLLGIAVFVISLAAAGLALFVGPAVPWARGAIALVLAAGVVCTGALGRIGASLLHAMFPG